MLKIVKASSVDDLIKQAIPSNIIDPTAIEEGAIGEPIP
jgi:glycine cleavage system pyridoxal-binding protein P